jgi:cytochrome c peroxidase
MIKQAIMMMSAFFSINSLALDLSNEPLKPLPKKADIEASKVELGSKLFHDTRLSGNNTISCASCHDLNKGGTDTDVVSTGIHGQKGGINSPTVYNSRHNFVQFWDGRAKNLEEQAQGPVENPVEMGANWQKVVVIIKSDPAYVRLFKKAYGGAITKKAITRAIADFERTLDTPSRFDEYLNGNENAINAKEKKGYALFKQYGCIACHSGINVGGHMYQKMGLVYDYFKDRGSLKKEDYGRFNVTGNDFEKHFFKVPTLRNIELTPPYFHDGSVKTLKDAVQKMGYYQLGIEIPDDDANDIVAFLKTLTGKSLQQSKK